MTGFVRNTEVYVDDKFVYIFMKSISYILEYITKQDVGWEVASEKQDKTFWKTQ